MSATLDLTRYAYAVGRTQAAWRFADAELREAFALATVSTAWDIYRRDAGAGDVGPAHETTPAAATLVLAEDVRRDSALLWLAAHGGPAVAQAAATVVRMVGATRPFNAANRALIDAARDALAHPATTTGPITRIVAAAAGSSNPAIDPLRALAAVVDRLRTDADFLEGAGEEVSLALPHGTLNRYVGPAPSGCWALNLALLAQGSQFGSAAPPGLVSRKLFRADFEPEEIAAQIADDAATAWSDAYDRLLHLAQQLARGRVALAHLSRNARTRDAWLLVLSLGASTRAQMARALGLSRAGADIQARALASAALVDLSPGGRMSWKRSRLAATAF